MLLGNSTIYSGDINEIKTTWEYILASGGLHHFWLLLLLPEFYLLRQEGLMKVLLCCLLYLVLQLRGVTGIEILKGQFAQIIKNACPFLT